MEHFFYVLVHHLDNPLRLVAVGGYAGLGFIIFAESGLLIGMFLPGDSLLFAAGLLAARGLFSYPLLAAAAVVGAIVGDSVGYWFGKRVGGALAERPDSRFFKQEYLHRTQAFYDAYGPRAVVLARFLAIIRTITPVLAGAANMPYRSFLTYNIIGGLFWGVGMVSLGYFLGQAFPELTHYILPLSLGLIVLSFLPIIINIVRGRRAI